MLPLLAPDLGPLPRAGCPGQCITGPKARPLLEVVVVEFPRHVRQLILPAILVFPRSALLLAYPDDRIAFVLADRPALRAVVGAMTAEASGSKLRLPALVEYRIHQPDLEGLVVNVLDDLVGLDVGITLPVRVGGHVKTLP